MQIKMRTLREIIREEIRRVRGTWWGDQPDKQLMDDDCMEEKSMLVPDDIKDAIRKFFKQMHL
jgi:hypothetical protein